MAVPPKVTLSKLLDLSLGTPEPGAVNFNALHTLLAALINQMKIQEMEVDFTENIPMSDSALSKRAPTADSGIIEGSEKPLQSGLYPVLEEKIKQLENQLKVLSALPSNPQLLESVGLQPLPTDNKTGPVNYMFQIMKMQRSVDTNTSAIDKV